LFIIFFLLLLDLWLISFLDHRPSIKTVSVSREKEQSYILPRGGGCLGFWFREKKFFVHWLSKVSVYLELTGSRVVCQGLWLEARLIHLSGHLLEAILASLAPDADSHFFFLGKKVDWLHQETAI
jgi:hypothetical protein